MKAKQLLEMMWAVAIITLVIACGEDAPVNPSILNPEQAAQKAQSVVDGQVTSAELDSLNHEWDVKITTTTGALVKVELVQSTGAIDKIEGIEGPFNYEVVPGAGLINFSVAKTSAFSAMEGITDNIKSWELEQNDLGEWIYEFTFLSGGQESKVKIDALNGHVIQ